MRSYTSRHGSPAPQQLEQRHALSSQKHLCTSQTRMRLIEIKYMFMRPSRTTLREGVLRPQAGKKPSNSAHLEPEAYSPQDPQCELQFA